MATAIESLVEYSNRYGSDPGMVLAGGGNTSMKTDQTLYIKGSGTSLATITEQGFVVMSRRNFDYYFLLMTLLLIELHIHL